MHNLPCKTLLTMLLLSFFGSYASASSDKAVEELNELIEIRTKELLKIEKAYSNALERIKVKLTKEADLESALVVHKELKAANARIDEFESIIASFDKEKSLDRRSKKSESNVPDHRLRITEASYGTRGKRVNVTEKLQKLANDERLDFKMARDILGDPVPYYKKYLVIVYRVNGREYRHSYHEGSKVSIPMIHEVENLRDLLVTSSWEYKENDLVSNLSFTQRGQIKVTRIGAEEKVWTWTVKGKNLLIITHEDGDKANFNFDRIRDNIVPGNKENGNSAIISMLD